MKRWGRIAGLSLLVCLAAEPLPASAESLADIFRNGNDAFFRKDFKAASQAYQRLVDAGVRDPDVFMNLGLAEAQGGALGRAVVSFERSLALRPDDTETESALALARATLGKRRADRQGEAVVETKPPLAEALVRGYRENTLAWLLLGFDVLLFACLFARRLTRSEHALTALAIAATVAALSCAITGSALFVKRGGHREGEAAIILRDGAELHEAPDPRASIRGYAHEGANARLLERDGNFARVRTGGGAQGWVVSDDVGTIAD